MTHICVSKLTIIVPDIGLSPGRRQAIIWTNARLLLTRPLETNFSEILIKIHTISFKKIHLKTSSGKCRPFCLGLNELIVLNWFSLFRRYCLKWWTRACGYYTHFHPSIISQFSTIAKHSLPECTWNEYHVHIWQDVVWLQLSCNDTPSNMKVIQRT